VKNVLELRYLVTQPLNTKLKEFLYKLDLVDAGDIYKENYYKKRSEGKISEEAEEIGKVLYDYYEPESVMDFGRAIGHYLSYFRNQGAEVKGVDAHPAGKKHAVVPEELIDVHDLRELYRTEKDYDMAICFEVLEHIPESFVDEAVASIADSSDLLAISAAPPGQGGTFHVNEKSKDFWIRKFDSRGFSYEGREKEEIISKCNLSEENVRMQNLMIFRKEGSD
jgi:hypothetical protein